MTSQLKKIKIKISCSPEISENVTKNVDDTILDKIDNLLEGKKIPLNSRNVDNIYTTKELIQRYLEKRVIQPTYDNVDQKPQIKIKIRDPTNKLVSITNTMLELKIKSLNPDVVLKEDGDRDYLIETLFQFLIIQSISYLKDLFLLGNKLYHSKKEYVMTMIDTYQFYDTTTYINTHEKLTFPQSVLNYHINEKEDLINFDIFKEVKNLDSNIRELSMNLAIAVDNKNRELICSILRQLKLIKTFISTDIGFKIVGIKDEVWFKYIGDHKSGHCKVCNRKIKRTASAITHVIAKSNGGETNVHNLRPTCRRCFEQIGDQFNMKEFCEQNFPNSLFLEDLCRSMSVDHKLIVGSDLSTEIITRKTKPKVKFADDDDDDDDE